MIKRLAVWLPIFTSMSLLGACGSDGAGSNTASVQERIDRCRDGYASCDGPSDDCNANAMECMNGVNGNGVGEDDIAEDCDALYELCSTKTDDLAFCEDLRQACFNCAHRYDDDDDDDCYDDDHGRDDDDCYDDDDGRHDDDCDDDDRYDDDCDDDDHGRDDDDCDDDDDGRDDDCDDDDGQYDDCDDDDGRDDGRDDDCDDDDDGHDDDDDDDDDDQYDDDDDDDDRYDD